MRRIFIGLTLLASAILLGCDKEIKEAARPASLERTTHS